MNVKFTALFLGVTASLGLGVAAHAGGLSAPVAEPVIAAPILHTAQRQDWTGFYVGGTLGYAFGADDEEGFRTYRDGQVVDRVRNLGNLRVSGANYGLHVGYRQNLAGFIIGPELSYEKGNVSDSFTLRDGSDTLTFDSEVNSLLSLKLKAGVELQDATLLYGIVGASRGDFTYRGTIVASDDSGTATSVIADYEKTGYLLGLGLERKLTDRLSGMVEWNYMNFSRTNLFLVGDRDDGAATYATPEHHRIKFGLNYQF